MSEGILINALFRLFYAMKHTYRPHFNTFSQRFLSFLYSPKTKKRHKLTYSSYITMKKITYRPVFNRKKKLNAYGTALLQIEAYLEGRKTYFSSHIYLKPEQWDNRKRMVKSHPHADALNQMLREFLIKLEAKELDLWKNGYEISLQRLKDSFKGGGGSSFLHFVKDLLESSQQKKSTQKNHASTLHWLVKFKPSTHFKDVDASYIYGFEQFLYKHGFQTNTVAKHMKHLKCFVNAAIDRNYIDANNYAFRRYRIRTKEAKHSFLLPEDLKKLEELTLEGKFQRLKHTLDAFLFCCYTGLRYSDFRAMSEKNFVRRGGNPWLVYTSVKTEVDVKLPISLLFDGKAWKILQKYKNSLSGFFNIKHNSTVNKDLILLKRLAKINTHISFHTARHTNATLLLHKGVNITTVQKLLGHRNLSTTQIYGEVMERTVVKDLKKCAKKDKDFLLMEKAVENG